MWQKGAMWNGTEGGNAEWDRMGLCGIQQKGAKGNDAEEVSADSGIKCLA